MGTEEQEGGSKNTAVKAGAAAIIVILLGFLWQSGALTGSKEPEAEPAKLAATDPAPVEKVAPPAEPAAQETAAVPEKPAEVAPPAPILPSFDVSRIAPDGQSLVAGRAEPGAKVQVLVDGVVVAESVVGADGAFTVLFSLGANAAASLMSLQTVMADGTVLVSDQTVAVAPITGPEAAPDATPPAAVLVTNDGIKVLEGAEEAAEPAAPATDTPAEVQVATADPAPAAEEEQPTAQRGTTEAPAPVAEAQTQTQTPVEPVAQVVLQAIGYSQTGDVMLSGRGEAGQAVRLYLDNAPLAETTVGADGVWQLTLAGIEPGVYTLRGDQVDGAGTVTARFETPFKRETREALAALANPTAPAPAQVAPAPEAKVAVPAVAEAAPTAEPSATPEAPKAVVEAEPKTEPEVPQTTALVEAPATQPAPPAEVQPQPAATAVEEPAAKVAEAPAQPEVGGDAPGLPVGGVSVTVQPGYTLWAIARDTYGDGMLYVQVYNANKEKIRDPNLIYPGQIFVVPAK